MRISARAFIIIFYTFTLMCGPGKGRDYNGAACEPATPDINAEDTLSISVESTVIVANKSENDENFSILYGYESGRKSEEKSFSVNTDSSGAFKISYSTTVIFKNYQSEKYIRDEAKIYILKYDSKIQLEIKDCMVLTNKTTKKGVSTITFNFYGDLPYPYNQQEL